MDDKTTQEPIEGQSVLPGFEGVSQVEEEHHAQEVEEEQLAPIYDPVQPFYTKRDKNRIQYLLENVAAIQAENHVYVTKTKEATEKGEKELAKRLTREWRKKMSEAATLMQEEDQLRRGVEQRYIESFGEQEDKAAAIMADVNRILDTITKAHYLRYQNRLVLQMGQPIEPHGKEDAAILQTIRDLTEVSIGNCQFFLAQQVRVQLNAFSYFDIPDEPLMEVLATKAGKLFSDTSEDAPALAKISYKNSKEIKSVTDKLMAFFYSSSAPAPRNNGDLLKEDNLIPLKYERNGSKKKITLYYNYAYNESTLAEDKIPKGFDSYDFFVATALDNLKERGNDEVSFSKILEEMGLTGSRPNPEHYERLGKALLKGASTMIRIDDKEIKKAWGVDTYHDKIRALYPIEIDATRSMANGFVTNVTVKIMGFSPFRDLADDLGHLTEWDKRILQLYTGKRTDRYWSVLQYLIREIGWMRNSKSKRSKKILYATLYAHTGDTSSRGRQLARDMLYRLLDEVFIPTGYISSRQEDDSTKPGVILTLGVPQIQG